MNAVGLRELKNRLSEYMRQVRSGDTILVTDRGEVVAELGPPGLSSASHHVPAALAQLAKRGVVTIGAPNTANLYPALARALRAASAAALLDAERGGR